MITGNLWYVNSPICVTTALTDIKDNNNRWMEFEANKNFPRGLKRMVDDIRGKYQDIKHIAVWHALVCGPVGRLGK